MVNARKVTALAKSTLQSSIFSHDSVYPLNSEDPALIETVMTACWKTLILISG